MDTKDKLALLEDMLDIEPGSLKEDMKLSDIEQYDSMSKLSLIVLFSDEFDKKLTGEKIRTFKTVGDIIESM